MLRLKSRLLSGLLLVISGQAAAERVDSAALNSLEPLASETPVAVTNDRPLLLQFWASWCHSCSGIMFDMDEMLEANDGVAYMAVSLDESRQDAAKYIRRHALFDKYSDRYFFDSDKKISDTLSVQTVPTIMLLNSNGDVLIKKSGHLNSTDKLDLVREIKKAL